MHKISITIDREQHTVLVVDDNPSTRYATTRLLRAAGFQTAQAATGSEGLDLAKGGGVSAVVLDVHLPDMDGFTVCRILREMPQTVVLPVIHLSATYIEASDKVAGLNSGADAYLSHPVEPAVLIATVQALIRARMAEEQLRQTEERYRQLLLEREQAARANAERLNRTKDDFVAVLSHELRNPLNAIVMNTHMLQRRGVPPEMAKGLEAIRRNAQTQARLISDILDASRINTGKLTLQYEPADPGALLQASMDALRSMAEERDVALELALDAPGPVVLDPARFQQILWNILHNAIKFSQPGGAVRVTLRQQPAALELAVVDEGRGIDPAFLERVFDKFAQVDAPGKRAQGGLGLGLPIVKHLVELHGGDIVLRSAGLGSGTTVSVRIPLRRGDAERGLPSAPLPLAPEGSAPGRLDGREILVVEDDEDAAYILAQMLEDRGARVVWAADVESALARLQAHRPDVLVSDIGLPGRDGYALVRALRADEPPGAHLPAIALTAFGRSDDRDMALQAGFDLHISKPLEPQALFDAIGRLLG